MELEQKLNQMQSEVALHKTRLLELGKLVTYCLITSSFRLPAGQGKLEKVREFEWSGKGQGKIFFWKSQGKVRENEKLVPPGVRFLGIGATRCQILRLK